MAFNSEINYENGVKIPFDEGFRIAPKDSVLMCIEGGSAGRKMGILNEDVCFGNKLCMFNPISLLSKYLFYYLQSNCFKEQFFDNVTGIIGGVSINKIKKIYIPIPPIKEQILIVDKIESLFSELKLI